MKNTENSDSALRLVVVGGVAGGASAAARARRLSESAEIIVLERGPDVSFANCGLPYYIGQEITDRGALAVQTPESLEELLNIEVRPGSNVLEIDREGKRVRVARVSNGGEEWLEYDKLLLAPGAAPLRPPLPGLDDPRVYTLRNLQDMDRIVDAAAAASSVVIVGAGFIGIEMAEQMVHLGKEVTLVELQDQVLPPMDAVMVRLLEQSLKAGGVKLVLGDGIQSVSSQGDGFEVSLASGSAIPADLVILSIGVRPETGLAAAAGLDLGERGHIQVNEFQQTSDPDIYAAGDAVETRGRVYGDPMACALGGPANRQGRVAADHIFRPEIAKPYPGSLGTAIVRAFKVAAGLTGWTEKALRQAGREYRTVTISENQHAGYYPGAQTVLIKIAWDPSDGRLLGGQVTGFEGVDKRIDVLATAISGQLTIDDLTHLELAYAPPFGSAKDPVNLAGFAASNARDGLCDVLTELPRNENVQVVDVRPRKLAEKEPVPGEGVINIPYPTLRANLDKLDRDRPVVTVCMRGKTSYFAARILAQNGFDVKSFTGGMLGNFNPPMAS